MVLRFSGFELDPGLRELRRDGQRVAIQKKLLDLLLYLIRFRGRVVPRAELLANVWPDAVVTEQALNQALYQARKVLGDDGGVQKIFHTFRSRGVRFVAEVTEVEDRPELAAAPFVGRAELLGDLESALRATCDGAGGLVLLSGEPGIGKTRVAEKFASVAREQAVVVHLGRCPEAEGAPPLWPWIQLLRAHAAVCQPPKPCELLGGGVRELARIVPEIHPDLANADAPLALAPGPARFRLFDSVTRFWRQASQREPIVLILDDLHRADDPSWLLLQFIAPELGSSRILVVGTYREVELHRDRGRGASLGELTRLPSTRCFELEAFSRDEVERFVELTIAARLSAETVTLLHEHSSGNPFFLTQLAPSVDIRRGGGSGPRMNGEPRFALPRSSREAITRHLAGLSPTCRELLTVAAVIGREFTLSALELATEHSRETVLDAVSAASEAGEIQESRDRVGSFRFAHTLVRDALSESLSTTERVNLHKRVGEALERLYGPDPEDHLTELAYHFAEAVPGGGEERAIGYAAAAGRAASEGLAFQEAVRQYQRALEIADLSATAGESSICDLLLALGRAQIRAGMRDSAREALRRAGAIARRLDEPERLARVALEGAPGFFAIDTGIHDPLIASLLEDALAALPPGDSELRAQLLGRLAMALCWSDCFPRRELLTREAVEIAERLEDPAATAFVTHARIVALWGPDSLDDRATRSTDLIEKAGEAGDQELSLIGRVFRIAAHLEAAEREDFDREIDIVCSLVHDPRHPGSRCHAWLLRAIQATLDGRFDDAERLAKGLSADGDRFEDANVIQSFAALMATVRGHQGRGQDVIDALARFSDSYPAVVAWRAASTLAQPGCGRVRQTTRDFDRLARGGFSSIPRDMNWLFCMAQLAEVCGMLNDVGRAAALYQLVRGYPDRWVVVGQGAIPWGPMARALGTLASVLSRGSEAEAHFRTALEVSEGIGAWPCVAWTLDSHARMLLARGGFQDRARAMGLARQANEISCRLGMEGLSRMTQSLIASEQIQYRGVSLSRNERQSFAPAGQAVIRDPGQGVAGPRGR